MTPNPDEPAYLKVEEVAVRLKLKEKTIRDWILCGELPAYKLGKKWRIRRDDFDQAMAARRTTAEPARTAGLWDPGDPGWPELRTLLVASGSLKPLRYVCILHARPEDIR
jgi:excisionase family DNA binding protein